MKKWALFGLVVFIFLALAPVALAATPQDIFNDFADNGKLDGTYTKAELRAYLNSSTAHLYGDSDVINRLDNVVTSLLEERASFPFTGFQIFIAIAVAAGLIGGGLLLRRSGRSAS